MAWRHRGDAWRASVTRGRASGDAAGASRTRAGVTCRGRSASRTARGSSESAAERIGNSHPRCRHASETTRTLRTAPHHEQVLKPEGGFNVLEYVELVRPRTDRVGRCLERGPVVSVRRDATHRRRSIGKREEARCKCGRRQQRMAALPSQHVRDNVSSDECRRESSVDRRDNEASWADDSVELSEPQRLHSLRQMGKHRRADDHIEELGWIRSRRRRLNVPKLSAWDVFTTPSNRFGIDIAPVDLLRRVSQEQWHYESSAAAAPVQQSSNLGIGAMTCETILHLGTPLVAFRTEHPRAFVGGDPTHEHRGRKWGRVQASRQSVSKLRGDLAGVKTLDADAMTRERSRDDEMKSGARGVSNPLASFSDISPHLDVGRSDD
jgi:hypothetical protein